MNKIKWAAICIIVAFCVTLMLQPVSVFAASPQAAGNWNTVVAKAKEEGKVVISTSNTPVVRQALAKGFKDAYGIDLEFIGGGKGSELGAKLLKERQAGMYLQDVYIGGTTTILNDLKPNKSRGRSFPAWMRGIAEVARETVKSRCFPASAGKLSADPS